MTRYRVGVVRDGSLIGVTQNDYSRKAADERAYAVTERACRGVGVVLAADEMASALDFETSQ